MRGTITGACGVPPIRANLGTLQAGGSTRIDDGPPLNNKKDESEQDRNHLPEGMETARGNCGFLDVSTILSKDRRTNCPCLLSLWGILVSGD
jgi:hypothetical protein